MQIERSTDVSEDESKLTTTPSGSERNPYYMDYEISELLDAATKAVQDRKASIPKVELELPGDIEKIKSLRDLDERVCLTSRSLYMRFKSTALWCRSVDKNTCGAVQKVLQEAVGCLPEDDYTAEPREKYNIRRSVEGRLQDFDELAKQMVVDPERPNWLVIPIPTPDDQLQPAC